MFYWCIISGMHKYVVICGMDGFLVDLTSTDSCPYRILIARKGMKEEKVSLPSSSMVKALA